MGRPSPVTGGRPRDVPRRDGPPHILPFSWKRSGTRWSVCRPISSAADDGFVPLEAHSGARRNVLVVGQPKRSPQDGRGAERNEIVVRNGGPNPFPHRPPLTSPPTAGSSSSPAPLTFVSASRRPRAHPA